MSSFISSYETKIVSEWCRNDLGVFEIIAISKIAFKRFYDRIKTENENYGWEWIPLEDALFKFKRIGRPLFGGNTAIKSRTKIMNVGLNFNRYEVALQREIDRIMRY